MIRFSCDSCGKTMKVKDELAGRKGRCPVCQTVLVIPQLEVEQESGEEFSLGAVLEQESAQPAEATSSGTLGFADEDAQAAPACEARIPAGTGRPIQCDVVCKIDNKSNKAVATFDPQGLTVMARKGGDQIYKLAWSEIDQLTQRKDKYVGNPLEVTETSGKTVSLNFSKPEDLEAVFRQVKTTYPSQAKYTALEMGDIKMAGLCFGVAVLILGGTLWAYSDLKQLDSGEKESVMVNQFTGFLYDIFGTNGVLWAGLGLTAAACVGGIVFVFKHFSSVPDNTYHS